MNAVTETRRAPRFTRVAAKDVETFIADRKRTIEETVLAKSILSNAKEEVALERARLRTETLSLEQRLQQQSDEISELSTKKFKAKQDALTAINTIKQVAVIAQDYQNLETWLSDAIMSGVNSILGELSHQERWASLIRSSLDKTKERWDLVLLCHPDDFDVLQSLAENEGFSGAISRVVRDETVKAGVCFLKGNSDFFELNLSARIEALENEITASLSTFQSEGI